MTGTSTRFAAQRFVPFEDFSGLPKNVAVASFYFIIQELELKLLLAMHSHSDVPLAERAKAHRACIKEEIVTRIRLWPIDEAVPRGIEFILTAQQHL